jgi:hypothetical protein
MTGDSVDQVVRRMRAIADALPPGDGVAVFNRVYLQVTELVRDQLITGGFDDPVFMEQLDVIFAGMYLVAVDQVSEAGKLARAWRPLLQKRERRDVYPVQFALAGMNAHINHDLALAVVATCGLAGREPPDVHGDYERINAILASVVRPIRQSFLDQAGGRPGGWSTPAPFCPRSPTSYRRGRSTRPATPPGCTPAHCGSCAACPCCPNATGTPWTAPWDWSAASCSSPTLSPRRPRTRRGAATEASPRCSVSRLGSAFRVHGVHAAAPSGVVAPMMRLPS